MSSPERLPQIPNVPTLSETIPGFSFTAWNGYFAPSGTPKPIQIGFPRSSQAIEDHRGHQAIHGDGHFRCDHDAGGNGAIIKRELPLYETAVKASGLAKQ